jgi:hypothetical protein
LIHDKSHAAELIAAPGAVVLVVPQLGPEPDAIAGLT